jgi:predicted  nucleic acid-binding Zn-ribbon protein
VKPEPRPAKRKITPTPPSPKRPTELELLEQEVVTLEQEVAELERRLAEDWSDVDTVTAHRRAREELQAALRQWEQLFERVDRSVQTDRRQSPQS